MKRILIKLVTLGLALAWFMFAGDGRAANYGVRIGNFFFNPTNLVIHPGDTVFWTNRTANDHDTSGGLAGTPDAQRLWKSQLLALDEVFSFNFTNAGYYPYICKEHVVNATSTHPEQTGSVSVVIGNILPTVAITNLPSTINVSGPTNLTIGATATDIDGTITNVSFFAGPNFLGGTSAPPFRIVASNLFAGAYSLTARATDNQGGVGTSAVVNITVKGKTNTIVVTNFLFIPATLTINVGDTIVFTNKAGSHTVTGTSSEPFCGPGTNSAPAFCRVTFTNAGSFGFVCVVHPEMIGQIIVNGPPSVILTNPPNGGSFNAPATIVLGAQATKPGGSIMAVQFFNGGTSLGTDTLSPYAAAANNLPEGTYTFTARATDNAGFIGFAPPVSISVLPAGPTLLSPLIGGGLFQFDITTSPGMTYVVQGTPALTAPLWTPLLTNVASSNLLHFSEPPSTSNKFYRALLQP